MKIKNTQIQLATKVLSLRDGTLDITMQALPIGIMAEYNKVFPEPVPPTRSITDRNGTRLEPQFHDPVYIANLSEHRELKNYFFVYKSIKADPNLQFDNIPADVTTLRAFAEELRASGLSEGELAILMMAATKLSSLTMEELDKAKENF